MTFKKPIGALADVSNDSTQNQHHAGSCKKKDCRRVIYAGMGDNEGGDTQKKKTYSNRLKNIGSVLLVKHVSR